MRISAVWVFPRAGTPVLLSLLFFSSLENLAALPLAQLLTHMSHSLWLLCVNLPRPALGATHLLFWEIVHLCTYCPMLSQAKVHTLPSQSQVPLVGSQISFGWMLPTLSGAVFYLPSLQSICFTTVWAVHMEIRELHYLSVSIDPEGDFTRQNPLHCVIWEEILKWQSVREKMFYIFWFTLSNEIDWCRYISWRLIASEILC